MTPAEHYRSGRLEREGFVDELQALGELGVARLALARVHERDARLVEPARCDEPVGLERELFGARVARDLLQRPHRGRRGRRRPPGRLDAELALGERAVVAL